jgi:hypothetical protein
MIVIGAVVLITLANLVLVCLIFVCRYCVLMCVCRYCVLMCMTASILPLLQVYEDHGQWRGGYKQGFRPEASYIEHRWYLRY